MSTERLEKDPAPSAIRYLVLASAFACLFTGLSFILAQVGTSSQEEQFYQVAMTGFTLVFVLTMLEWFLLRRSRKLIGPYGLAFVLEIMKFFLFNFATAEYIEAVPRVSASPFFLHQMLSLGIIFMLALTKVARTRLEQLAQKDLSRNVLNLLPTLLILVVFLGTYVTEIVGLGTPRQRINFEEYEKKNIDWSLYGSPTWDATYLLENLLDQFTAGLQNPFSALFNVSNQQGSDPTSPPAYWRIGSLETYEYYEKGEDPTTRWTSDDPGYRILTPTSEKEGTSYSSNPSSTAAQFLVEVPLDYSTEISDVSVNPSFPNYLPTTWNGKDGSYIDENSFILEDANGRRISTISTQTREVFPGGYPNSINDLLGIQAVIKTDDTDTKEGVLKYIMNYADISETMTDAALFSQTKDDYPTAIGSSAEWSNIQELYLQYPNSPSELPETAYVDGRGEVSNPADYEEWAPDVVASTDICTIEGQSVFSQAYTEMLRLAPNYFQNSNEDVTEQLSIPNDESPQELTDSTGEFDLVFDFDMWLGEYSSMADPLSQKYVGADYEMPHPQPGEDYNEWFINNRHGTALHFASLFVTMMRLRGIPSRVVIGYLGGADSEDKSKLVITNMMLHAWAEVLVPIEEIIPGIPPTVDNRAEWVSFDPLLKFLSDMLATGTPIDMPVISEVSNVVLINDSFPHQTIGPAVGLALANYVDTDADATRLSFTQNIDLSVRVMMMTSLTTWMPWQPACEYLETEVSFYWGNTQNIGDAELIDTSPIDSSGYSFIEFNYELLSHGSPIWFFAEIVFNEGEVNEHRATATSLRHRI